MNFWITLSLIILVVFAASFLLGEWLVRRAARRDTGGDAQGM